jgi:cholesterol oxidase
VSGAELRRLWHSLPPPAAERIAGDHRAELIGPGPWVAFARRGLGLVGLPGWYGKRFSPGAGYGTGAASPGINLLGPAPATAAETLPMSLSVGPSRAYGMAAAIVTYPPGSPWPWRRVRDEFRVADERRLLGMTFVDLPGASRRGTPFWLVRTDDAPTSTVL